MKNAYLIMAHKQIELLADLIYLLDDYDNDIYLHLDKKMKIDNNDISKIFPQKSDLYIIERKNINWGGYSQIELELELLKKAISEKKYDYYHLLSGQDLPIKNNKQINDFLQLNKGTLFVDFDTEQQYKKFLPRIKYYHIFQEKLSSKKRILKYFFIAMERISLTLQKVIGVNRIKNNKKKYFKGANWFSITHSLAKCVVEKESEIKKEYKNTMCADEIFLQSIIYNSDFKNNLYNHHKNGNLRYIDWRRGKPYIWRNNDFDELMNAPDNFLFARKFDYNTDSLVIKNICKRLKTKEITKNKDLISIIVPMYNVENTIEKCVKSILEQTYENIEIILVNDGSTDNTLKVCQKYQDNSKVIIINKQNEGVSEARNCGIEKANGKYIVFIDADDYIEKNMVKELYENLGENDLVICGKNIIKNNSLIQDPIIVKKNTFSKEEWLTLYKAKILNPPYCKLYLKEIIDNFNIRFPKEISVGEDLIFNLNYIKHINNNVRIVNKNLYNYVLGNGLSRKYTKNMLTMKKGLVKTMAEVNSFLGIEETIEITKISWDFIWSSITNEFAQKNTSYLKKYISAYKKIHTREFQEQLKNFKEKKIVTKFDYLFIQTYLFFIYMIKKKIKDKKKV